MRTALKAWLFATCAIAGFGCTEGDKTQVLTGRVSTRGAIAVRAIDGDTVITASRVRSDGTFTLSLPANHHYRLEVLSEGGVHNVVGRKDGALADIAFSVCDPQPPWDMGGFGQPGCDPTTDPMCVPPCDPMTDPNCSDSGGGGTSGGGGGCQPGDPNCMPPCDPTTDPMCKPWPCDPDANGNCQPPCDPMTDPNCVPPPPPPPCDPTTDPMCKCYPGDPNCPPPCDPMTDPNCAPPPTCDPSDPMCQPCADGDPNCKCDWWNGTCDTTPCDPMIDPMCPTPPPPCTDPTDPNTCKDPCMVDPIACGCGTDANGTTMTMADGTTDTTCWPPPEPCTMGNCPDDPWSPEHPPGDFGCGDAGGGDGTVMPAWDGMK